MIFRIQSVPAITCSPALGDTVAGVGGIIIGFDPIANFDAYIQNTGGGPFSGIDFFTGSINTKSAPYNWAIGDSIIIEYGKVGSGTINSPNGQSSTPNWIARKISSGNPLPPFLVGTATQLRELPTNTIAEQYKSCLVKVYGPMTVVRTSLTGGITKNSFLLVSASAPNDSVFIEGNKLTTYAPPALGMVIQTVRGILGQTSRGPRIYLRDERDIAVGRTIRYSLSASATGHGNVSLTPDLVSYEPNSVVTLNPIAEPGFGFVKWTGDTLTGTNPLVLTINRNMSVTADFDSALYTITTSAGPHGSTTLAPLASRYARGATVHIIPLPDPGYRLSSWSGDSTTTRDTISIVVAGPASFHADFIYDPLAAAHPLIVKDVPGDQGGHITATWPASRLEDQYPHATCCYTLQRGSASDSTSGWTTVGSTAAIGAALYQILVPTPSDSTALNSSAFRYRLLTVVEGDTATWSSPVVIGSSTDNIAPPQVASFHGTIASGRATLSWSPVDASDLAGYYIYRGPTADFPTDAAHRIGVTAQTQYNDFVGNLSYYKVTAVDIHDNESPATEMLTLNATDVDGEPRGIPARLELSAPHPSPSQGDFRVELGLPRARMVHAEVVDLSGRVIRALHASELPAGWKALRWDARDDRGARSAPGLYFLRVTVAGEGCWTRRLILTR